MLNIRQKTVAPGGTYWSSVTVRHIRIIIPYKQIPFHIPCTLITWKISGVVSNWRSLTKWGQISHPSAFKISNRKKERKMKWGVAFQFLNTYRCIEFCVAEYCRYLLKSKTLWKLKFVTSLLLLSVSLSMFYFRFLIIIIFHSSSSRRWTS